ncbi:dihydrofolate reductase family protein [Streptomyces sp. NPDC001691]|uniref:dihydrofolate reductase family protein n=1 Tax=Streptomyces sp. NPDC001691 TaxID=3364600 RepID=UPI00369249C8
MTTTRKIIHSVSVSLDGFFAGPEGQIDWHLVDDELHRHFNEQLATMGAFLEGRVTHELMAEYWPTADADPAAPAAVAEFAHIWREMPKVVFSRTLEKAEWNATVRHEVDVAEIEALKAQRGGDLVLGSADLAATFRRHDLIDEYRLYVHPVLLGTGRRLFAVATGTHTVRLVETRTFGNGVVLLRYARDRTAE